MEGYQAVSPFDGMWKLRLVDAKEMISRMEKDAARLTWEFVGQPYAPRVYDAIPYSHLQVERIAALENATGIGTTTTVKELVSRLQIGSVVYASLRSHETRNYGLYIRVTSYHR